VGQHDFDFDPEDALAEQDVTNGSIDVLLRRVTAVNHQPVHEFHSLGSLTTQFSRNDHLAALGTGLHDETEDSVTRSAHGETADQLVAKGLGLSDGAQTAGGNLFGVEFDGPIGVIEPLLHYGSEFANSLSLIAEDILSARSENDDLGARWRNANLLGHARLYETR